MFFVLLAFAFAFVFVFIFGECTNGQHGLIGEWDAILFLFFTTIFAVVFVLFLLLFLLLFFLLLFLRFVFAFIFGECTNGQHGLIGEWDVSRVTDMGKIFYNASSFDGDIS